MDRWNNIKDVKPIKEGRYLVQIMPVFGDKIPDEYDIKILEWCEDLFKFDNIDFEEFKGTKTCGFIEYDPDYGYNLCKDVIYWMNLPEVMK